MTIEIELAARASGWVAVGYSTDRRMVRKPMGLSLYHGMGVLQHWTTMASRELRILYVGLHEVSMAS